MEVMLLEDLKGVGKKFDIRAVSDGYARNFLIPKKLAIVADQNARRMKVKMETQENVYTAQLAQSAKHLENEVFEFPVATGDRGEMFGSVSAKDIENALKERGYGKVEAVLERGLKTTGEHTVIIDFGKGIKAPVRVIIQPR